MLRIQWTHKTIETNDDAELMRALFKRTNHTAAAFDTETDGLNIIRCKPFLYQFGWYDRDTMQGYTFVVDLEEHPKLGRLVIKVWHALVKNVPKYLGHNVKFDLHMVTNIGLPYDGNNISDGMAWIRLGMDAIPVRKGGAPLKLKDFAVQYIDRSAKEHEHKIKAERTAIASALNQKLRRRLGWTQKKIETFFKDCVHEAEDLPEDKRQAYYDWHTQDLPLYLQPIVSSAVDSDMISYKTLNRQNVIDYGHLDIVWELEAFDVLEEAVRLRGNLPAMEIEESNIYPVYEMERVGFKADKVYLMECKSNLKQYILARRQDMFTLAGREFTLGQHAVIKEILTLLGTPVTSTGAEELDILVPKLMHEGGHETAVDFIEAVQELRTLEKWYSTYIMRFMIDLKYGDMLYTQINLSGAVSGRVTCDFQQFPKGHINTIYGVPLFEPRRIFIVPDGYKAVVYLDYSQVELRLQAMYTILVSGGDLNLCRAYMPFKCHTYTGDEGHQNKMQFNCEDMQCLNHSYDWAWYLDEAPDTKWTPTDVHGATTKAAFNIDETDERFHELRYIGKTANFAKNYGAQRGRMAQMFPQFDDEVIDMIDKAYYIAFPGVKEYHNYCYAIANKQAYVQNLYGVRYYNMSGHNVINVLPQGTGAYILKTKIPQINAHIKERGYKSVMQMQIHDEISFLWHDDDSAEIFFELKNVMEQFTDFIVPIVAEMEVTYTTWADKKGIKTIEELNNQICAGH